MKKKNQMSHTNRYILLGLSIFCVLEMAIPKSVLGLSSSVNLEFKWSDNMQDEGIIMDFYVNGDVAPGGRFNFVYCSVGD